MNLTAYTFVLVQTKAGKNGGDAFVSKLRKHIDNDTIYWDESKQVIKSKGGGHTDYFHTGIYKSS